MRMILRIVAAGLALLLVVGAGGFAWLRSSLPQTTGTLDVAGLRAPATIARDRVGLARIRAESEHDAYFALGFLHAQDRMWQMEVQRRAGAGRLAEVMGAAALPSDKFTRTLGLYRLAEASLAHLGPEANAVLEAYAAGVNAWIADRGGALPPEFVLLGYAPEPWRPADSIVWARLMGLQLAGNWREELLRAALLQKLPPEKVQQLWAPYAAGAPTTVSLDSGVVETMIGAIPEIGRAHLASNVWAVDGTRTPSGKPLLANDPHLGFDAPILWYLASITTPGFEMHGATVPGVPFHLIGHNGTVAWGITTTHSDLMDLFVEQAAGDSYLTPEGPRPFELRQEVIRVKDGEPVILAVRSTRHGPVISDVLGERAGGQTLALSSATLQPVDRTPLAFHLMNRAKDWSQFVAALRHFHSPQQNVAYADTAGNIGFYTPGLVPIRRQGDGLVPRQGWTGEWDWVGWVPFEELPQLVNPPEGRVVNANNQVVPEGYPYLIAANWPEPYRAARILDVLDQPGKHGPADAAALQNDNLSPVARQFKGVLAGAPLVSDAARQAQRMVAAWDGVMRRDRPEPLIFNAWMIAFQQALLADELGTLATAFRIPRPRFLEVVLSRDATWCDDVATPVAETCIEIAGRALEHAVAELSTGLGDDPAAWRWGDRHQAVFDHALFQHVPVLDRLSRLSIPSDGGDFTVNRGTFDAVPPGLFTHVHGPGLRAIFDLSDLAASRFMISTGQSGNLLSPHWDDLLEPWRDGAYVQFASTADAEVLTLRPPP